jgi:hypothetical protein
MTKLNPTELVPTVIPATDRHDISVDMQLFFIITLEVINSGPKPGAIKFLEVARLFKNTSHEGYVP